MLNRIDTYLRNQSGWRIFVGAALLICILGPIDLYVGYEVSFSIFYSIPIVFCAWYGSRRGGYVISVMSAATWLAMDYWAGQEYSLAWIPFWNAAVRFGFFFIIASLLAQLKMRLDKEQLLARVDGLTKLLNTRMFKEEMNRVMKLAERYRQPVALGFIDLDNFKQVNDSLGHSEGDRVLRAVGSILKESLRVTDLVGRMGGDEFALLLPQTNLTGAQTAFNSLRCRLLDAMAEHGWPIGFSMGVAVFQTSFPQADDALRHADDLMYKVKKGGKGSILYDVHGGDS